jgi:hypothetical protein
MVTTIIDDSLESYLAEPEQTAAKAAGRLKEKQHLAPGVVIAVLSADKALNRWLEAVRCAVSNQNKRVIFHR